MTKIFLPLTFGNGPSATGEQGIAQQLFELMRDDPGQKRKEVIWHPLIASVAQARVESMARDGWFTGHIDNNGHGPNWWLLEAGYKLAYDAGPDGKANTVESTLCGGDGKPEEVWQGWLNSPHHRPHVLGLIDFYAAQTQVGIGAYYLKESWAGHYFSVISCPPENGYTLNANNISTLVAGPK